MDVYTISFGIRNVTSVEVRVCHAGAEPCASRASCTPAIVCVARAESNVLIAVLQAALSEAFRVLKPGGRFMCLEFRWGVRCWAQR